MPKPCEPEDPSLRLGFEAIINDNEPDFTIKLNVHSWRVHARIFTRKSGFFKTMIGGGSAWSESNEQMVTLHDDDPQIWARVLQFMYYGRYYHASWHYIDGEDITKEGGPGPSVDGLMLSVLEDEGEYSYPLMDNHAETDLEVYALADKYDIPGLRKYSLEYCVDSFLSESRGQRDRCPDLVGLFDKYYPPHTDQDRNIKRAIAACIAGVYSRLRRSEEEWELGVGEWLKKDFELCTMVMDNLEEPEKEFAYKFVGEDSAAD